MDATQWPQGIIGVSKPVEAPTTQETIEKKARPQKDKIVNCPRCNSTNTKFCYYNNYSLSQPRYFCKTCRRYWTAGGTLRNVPVGGGSRKHKRPFPTSSSKKPNNIQDLTIPSFSNIPPHHNPRIITHIGSSQDLNLAYPLISSSNNYTSFSNLIASNTMDFLKNGIPSSKELHSFMTIPISDSNTVYSSAGTHLHDLKPTLDFSLDGFDDHHHNVFGNNNDLRSGGQESSSSEKIFQPLLDDSKQVANANEFEQNRAEGGEESNNGYWEGYSW